MANITAADIVYTDKNVYSPRIEGLPPRKKTLMSVAMGNATNKTYPSGGIPVTASGLGLGTFLEHVKIVDTSGSETALWTYDVANQKLRAYTAEGTEMSGAFTNNTQTLVVEAVGY